LPISCGDQPTPRSDWLAVPAPATSIPRTTRGPFPPTPRRPLRPYMSDRTLHRARRSCAAETRRGSCTSGLPERLTWRCPPDPPPSPRAVRDLEGAAPPDSCLVVGLGWSCGLTPFHATTRGGAVSMPG